MKRAFSLIAILGLGGFSAFGQSPEKDIGPRVHIFGRPAMDSASSLVLGDTGYTAFFSVGRYMDEKDSDPDFITISVQKKEGRESHVYFQREFEASALPRRYQKAKVEDVAKFDKHERTVTFKLDGQVYQYALPDNK